MIEVVTDADPGDWEESATPGDLHGLPEAVAPVKPEGAVEPPHTPVAEDDDEDQNRSRAADSDSDGTGRDESGRFKPRHRARSQTATPDDVATIAALTARIKAAEEADGADIARKENESERVFALRRRAEVLERRRANGSPSPGQIVAPTAPAAAPVAARVAPRPAAAMPEDDPEPNPADAAKYADGVYDPKFISDYSRWAARDEHRKLSEQSAKEHGERETIRAFGTRVDAARVKYPDFEAIAFNEALPIPMGSPTDIFIMEDESGAEVLYHLRKNPAELRDVLGKPALQQLKTLSLLSQRLMSPPVPAQAVTTGSAAAPARTTTPRPPNPVRTGPVSASTGPPSDDDSLEAHERHFYPRRRRD